MYHICSNTQFLIVLFGYSKNCDFGECLFDILYFSDILSMSKSEKCTKNKDNVPQKSYHTSQETQKGEHCLMRKSIYHSETISRC